MLLFGKNTFIIHYSLYLFTVKKYAESLFDRVLVLRYSAKAECHVEFRHTPTHYMALLNLLHAVTLTYYMTVL